MSVDPAAVELYVLQKMSKPIYEGWIKENGQTRWGTSDKPIKEDAWRIEDGKVYWGISGKNSGNEGLLRGLEKAFSYPDVILPKNGFLNSAEWPY